MLVFVDSGKTALAFAYLLQNRPAGTKPSLVVGIGSNASRQFAKGTGLYNKILIYESDDSDDSDLDGELGLKGEEKIVVVEFGSRGDAANRLAIKLQPKYGEEKVVQLIVAGENVVESPEEATKNFLKRKEKGASQFNASNVRVKAIKTVGEGKLQEELEKD